MGPTKINKRQRARVKRKLRGNGSAKGFENRTRTHKGRAVRVGLQARRWGKDKGQRIPQEEAHLFRKELDRTAGEGSWGEGGRMGWFVYFLLVCMFFCFLYFD